MNQKVQLGPLDDFAKCGGLFFFFVFKLLRLKDHHLHIHLSSFSSQELLLLSVGQILVKLEHVIT